MDISARCRDTQLAQPAVHRGRPRLSHVAGEHRSTAFVATKQVVLAVYLVGLLLAAAIYPAIAQGLYQVDNWMYTTWWGQFFGEVLLVGALSMGIVYAAVRGVVYFSPEFDERLDGIIYGMAAALGVATVVNFLYVLRHEGVDTPA